VGMIGLAQVVMRLLAGRSGNDGLTRTGTIVA
jgi:hypothetical protein